MRALCWHGKGDVRVDTVPDPRIEAPGDIVVQVTSTAICGSDLHLLNGFMPAMKAGDILGHEFMGEVVETGVEVKGLKVGDRVVIPFVIACGACFFCQRQMFSGCDASNPDAAVAAKAFGHAPAGMFGYTHMLGGFSGGQAEYVRVPYADVGALKVPNGMKDEQVLFLSDILPTGYVAALNANIQPGDTVAVWGCGPVGQFAIASALLLKAGRVIAIDRIPERLALAKSQGADTFDFTSGSVKEYLDSQTEGRGPDSCIDAVGMEAHGWGSTDAVIDKVKVAVMLGTDRIHALREAILCCRKFGTVSFAGVYGGMLDNVPFGAAFNKGLTLRMGQTPVQAHMKPLLKAVQEGAIDPTFVITHRMPLDDAPRAYELFRDKQDECIKVVMTP